MRRLMAAGLFAAVVAGAPAVAGPLNKDWVDRDARWLVHVDVEAAAGSTYAPLLHAMYLQSVEAMGDGRAREVLDRSGLDLLRDVKGATAFGLDMRGEESLLILHGTTRLEAMLEPLAAELPGYEQVEAGLRQTVFSWNEGNSKRYGLVRQVGDGGDRLMVFAPGRDQLDRVVALLGRTAPSLAASQDQTMMRAPAPGSMLFILAHGLNEEGTPSGRGQGAMLSRLSSALALDVGESGQNTYMELALTARKEREADAMIQLMNGMIAMAHVTAASEPEFQRLAAMLDVMRIEREGSLVTARMSTPSSLMMEAMSGLPGLPVRCDLPEGDGAAGTKEMP
jgi:hypothetical protein